MLNEPPLVLDSDFISNFGWVQRLDILENLFPGQMVLLEEVETEIARIDHIFRQVQNSINNKKIIRHYISVDTDVAIELARLIDEGKYGRGESAIMAYLKYNRGTMGSDNFSDVATYCIENNKKLICTGDCLCHALNKRIVDSVTCERLWKRLKDKQRRLPTMTFTEYKSNLFKY